MKKSGGVESNFDWVVRVLLEICVELWGFREVWWIMWKSWLNQLDWTCDDYFEMRYGREILSLRVFKYLISWLCDFNFFGVSRANWIVTAVMTQLAMEFWPFMVNRTLVFFEFNLGYVWFCVCKPQTWVYIFRRDFITKMDVWITCKIKSLKRDSSFKREFSQSHKS